MYCKSQDNILSYHNGLTQHFHGSVGDQRVKQIEYLLWITKDPSPDFN